MKRILLVLLLFIFYALPLFTQNLIAIKNVNVVHTHRKAVVENTIVLIRDSIILDIGRNINIPADAVIINAEGKYLIPGLVDGHIHFFQSGGLYTRPDGLDLTHRRSYEDEMKWVKENVDDVFRRYIRCGITTVYDLGGPMWNFDVRDYSKKAGIAPRVFLSGPLIASYQPDALTTDYPPIIKVNTVEEALKQGRLQVEQNTDFIKIWYVVGRDMTGEEFEPIVKEIIKESHRLGKPVWVHAYELDESVKRALKDGADVLVHSVRDKEVDKEFINLAKKNNVKYIPTMWVFNSYAAVYTKQLRLLTSEHLLGNPYVIGTLFDMHQLEEKELSERIKKLQHENKAIVVDDILNKNLIKVHQSGITVAAGTDAGNVGVIHGPSLFHEFALMKNAGMSDYDILITATLNGAKLLGNEKNLGSVEKGKLADLVLLNANPVQDIQSTSDIYLVIKDGKLFYPNEVLQYSPEDLAQIQLNAYNEKNLEAFLEVFADDVEIYNFPNELRTKGKEEMRKLYADFFDRAGDLHCRLVNRIVHNNYVMDKEDITTSIPGREKFEGQAIYEIKDQKIWKVWFMK